MSSVHAFGGPERLEALAVEWADEIHLVLAARGLAIGSASYLDAANREISGRLRDLRIDAPHAAVLATMTMRQRLSEGGGAA